MSTYKHKKRISIHVTKKQGESNEKLVSIFQKKVKGSRLLNEVKERRYYTKPLKRRKIRQRALMREGFRAAREKAKFL